MANPQAQVVMLLHSSLALVLAATGTATIVGLFVPGQSRFRSRAEQALRLLAQGRGSFVVQAIGTRLQSETRAFGLRRELSVPHAAPAAKIALVVRPLAPGDDLSMIDDDSGDPQTGYSRLAQRRLVAANIPTCWVAIAPDGKVCYMQWLIAPADNHRVAAYWGDLFPQLRPHEALLEGAFTGDAYRGQGIMPHAMALIAAQAGAFGACRVITFVGQSNIASLKGCKKAGFVPYITRTESWRLLTRRVQFGELPAHIDPF